MTMRLFFYLALRPLLLFILIAFCFVLSDAKTHAFATEKTQKKAPPMGGAFFHFSRMNYCREVVQVNILITPGSLTNKRLLGF